jgi:hypothetical protein
MVIGTKIVFLAVGSVFLTAAAGWERSVASTKVDQAVGSKIDEMAFQTNFLGLNTAGAARAGEASVPAGAPVSEPEPSTIAILTVGATCCGMWLKSRVRRTK